MDSLMGRFRLTTLIGPGGAGKTRLLATALAVRGGPDHSRPDAARVEDAARDALGDAYGECAAGGGVSGPASVPELARVTLAG
ncbi:hypothetical protein ACFY04_05975 [Streptomyces sp. NPDC001549]|uniref:hypothetical protein n=1 Tax=Streptomyces sp. NPDC001549 TaxID=3364586 RepID=UPI003693F4EA